MVGTLRVAGSLFFAFSFCSRHPYWRSTKGSEAVDCEDGPSQYEI
jgi:hypothetical protein